MKLVTQKTRYFPRFVTGLCLVLACMVASLSHYTSAGTVEVLMKTSAGDVQIQLYPLRAPKSVANFLKYVDGKHYNGGSFYRVVRDDNQVQNDIKIGVIQGGMGMGVSSLPFPPIEHETTKQSGLLHEDGAISLARGAPGTAQAEFFICVDAQTELDHGGMRNPDGLGFAVFGRVISGMDIVRAIQNGTTDTPDPENLHYTSGQILLAPVAIESITRVASWRPTADAAR